MLIRLGALFFIASLVFWLWALFDSITSDGERVRNLPKLGWVVVILIGFEVGALAWVLLGRPRRGDTPTGFTGLTGRPSGFGPRGPQSPRGPRGPRGPVGPDDDPDFLKGI